MKDSIKAKTIQMLVKQGYKKRLLTIVSVLGLFATVSVFYMLSLPAITMEQAVVCDKEEHEHTDDCYGQVQVCEYTANTDEEKELTCVEEESDGHSHGTDCFEKEERNTCGLQEDESHSHSSACFEEVDQLTCEKDEAVAHTHGDGCYTVKEASGEAIDHVHGDSCFEKRLTCEKEAHKHGENCSTGGNKGESGNSGEFICGKEVHEHDEELCYETTTAENGETVKTLKCEIEAHTHTDECKSDEVQTEGCQLVEHEHGEDCYVIENGLQKLVCEILEHKHDDTCGYVPGKDEETEPNYICGYEGHEHEEACYEIKGGVSTLICTKDEHIHTDECIDKENPTKPVEKPDYVCGLEEHEHTEDCYRVVDGISTLVCGTEEHTHTEDCIDGTGSGGSEDDERPIICGFEEHTHTSDCHIIKDGIGQLNCDKTEHTHTEECYGEPGQVVEDDDYEYDWLFSCGIKQHLHSGECYEVINRSDENGLYTLVFEEAYEGNEVIEDAVYTRSYRIVELVPICGEYEEDGHKHDRETCFDMLDIDPNYESADFEINLLCKKEEHEHAEECLMTMYSMMFAPMSLVNQESSELEDFVDGVRIVRVVDQGGDKVEVPFDPATEEANAGEIYRMYVAFSEILAVRGMVYNADGVLTYHIPTGVLPVSIPASGFNGVITGKVKSGALAGEIINIGEYVIFPNGSIEVEFYNIELETGSTIEKSFIDYYTNASFEIMFEASFERSGKVEEKEINFGNDVTIKVKVNDKTDMIFDKAVGTFGADRTIDFVLTVRAINGTLERLHIVDDIWLVRNRDNIRMDSLNSYLSFPKGITVTTIDPDSGFELKIPASQITLTESGSGKTAKGTYEFDITGLKLQPGQTAVIKYTIKLDEVLFDKPWASWFSYYLYNKATASGYDAENNKIVKDDEERGLCGTTKYYKSGKYKEVSDGTKTRRLIEWTIAVGDGNHDVHGMTVTDTLGSNQKYFVKTGNLSASTYNFYLARDWSSRVINGWIEGSGLTLQVPGNPAASRWFEVKIDDPYRHANPDGTYGADGKQRAPSDGLKPFYRYNIRFFTEIDDSFTNGTIKNTAVFSNGAVCEASVTIAEKGPEKVDPRIVKGSNIRGEKVHYKIVATIPKEANGMGFVFADVLMGINAKNEDEPEFLYFENKPDPHTFKVSFVDMNDDPINQSTLDYYGLNKHYLTYGSDISGNVEEQKSHTWYLSFIEDAYSYATAKPWPLDFDVKIIIEYDIPFTAKRTDGENGLHPSNETLGDYITQAKWFDGIANDIYLKYDGGHLNDTDIIYPLLAKKGQWLEDSKCFEYLVEINQGRTTSIGSFDAPTAPKFTDRFDENLEFVPGSRVLIGRYVGGSEVARCDITTLVDTSRPGEFSFDFQDVQNQATWSKKYKTGTDWWKDTESTYYVLYYLRVKEDADLSGGGIESKSFTNTVTLTAYDESNSETNYNASAIVDYMPITKSMIVAEGGASADVTIMINQSGTKLAGQGHDTIKVVDVMSKTLALRNTTLKVERFNGSVWVEEPLTQSDSGAAYTYEVDLVNNTITFAFPDATPLRLTYQVMVKGTAGEEVTVSNAVTVIGYANFTTKVEETFEIFHTIGVGDASKTSFTLVKQDEETGQKLEGAMFALYINRQPLPEHWKAYKAQAESIQEATVKPIIKIDGVDYYFIGNRVTDNGGMAAFDDEKGYIVSGAATYALVEYKEPMGYLPLENPIVFALDAYEKDNNQEKGVELYYDLIGVTNRMGVKLPETGGISGQVIAQAGAVILALAGAVIITTRRRAGDFS